MYRLTLNTFPRPLVAALAALILLSPAGLASGPMASYQVSEAGEPLGGPQAGSTLDSLLDRNAGIPPGAVSDYSQDPNDQAFNAQDPNDREPVSNGVLATMMFALMFISIGAGIFVMHRFNFNEEESWY